MKTGEIDSGAMSTVAIAIPVQGTKGEKAPLVAAQPLSQLPVARPHPWPVETVTAFLALPEVQADVMNQSSTWRITLLKLLAWKALEHHAPEARVAQVAAWLPHPHHAGVTGTDLAGVIRTMNARCAFSPMPPFTSHHHYCTPQLTLSALLDVLERWQASGQPLEDLLTAGRDLAAGSPKPVPVPTRRWWWWC